MHLIMCDYGNLSRAQSMASGFNIVISLKPHEKHCGVSMRAVETCRQHNVAVWCAVW